MKFDERSKESIIEEIEKRAKSYTPEWSMDRKNPDIAAALALAYADMLAGTRKKVNGIPLKNKIAFFNMINASLLPASPSEGYVSFSLSADDVGNTEIGKGAVMSSYSADGDTMRFETCDDILVSPAKIVKAFCADDSDDFIGEYEGFPEERTALFSLPRINLQSHIMRLSHPYAFGLGSEGRVELRFVRKGGTSSGSECIKALADTEVADIEYYAGEEAGYVHFSETREEGGALVFVKGAELPGIVKDEDGFDLRITVKDMTRTEELTLSYIEAYPSGDGIAPDHVTNGNIEYDINEFYPFGERFGLFDEVYFGSPEVLDKRGAKITVSFDMSIVEVPIENQLDEDGINWKWVANKKDFKEAKSYKIAITEVIWEYYNGDGWSRLFPDRTASDLFSIKEGVTASFKSMTFTCPEDMSETFVGAHTGYYIRARILKAENLYKTKGWYLSPFIRNISFEYHYENNGCRITDILTCNNIAEQRYDPVKAALDGFTPFRCAGASNRTVYFGFSAPPDNGPMRMLWDIEEGVGAARPKLKWTYLSSTGWRAMNIADETENFSKVGSTVFLDNHDFVRTTLFGETLFWVSVTDTENIYRTRRAGLPIVDHIYPNSVRAVNVDSHNEEYFAMNIYSEDSVLDLSSGNVLDLELYVNEYGTITDNESDALEAQDRMIRVTGSGGIDTEIWVKWNEVNSFAAETNESRSFVLDRSSGKITFGNGRKGRIPPVSDVNNIRVIYTTGGGERTNIAPGGISGLDRSYGFVSGAVNMRRFYGGSDTETIHEAMRRSAVTLRTQGKAVTIRDLESITFNASRNIRKLRCVSGRNAAGDREHGAVTLVVLKREHSEFGRIKNDILRYLAGRLPGDLGHGRGFYITEPTFIKVNVRAEIKTREINGIFELKKNAEQQLADYFASFSGTDGDNVWRLGMVPNEQQIRSALLRMKNVVYIRSLYITMYVYTAGGLKEIDSDNIGRYSYILPQDGEHDIRITVD